MRRLLCLLLILCLPLQSFAAQVGGLQSLQLAGLTHEIEHVAELHHHENDGAIHYDDSEQSVAHADEHSAAAQFSVLHSINVAFSGERASLADYPDPASYLPNPFQEDPQRPPAFAPGLAAGG